jgi:hypothetical protein
MPRYDRAGIGIGIGIGIGAFFLRGFFCARLFPQLTFAATDSRWQRAQAVARMARMPCGQGDGGWRKSALELIFRILTGRKKSDRYRPASQPRVSLPAWEFSWRSLCKICRTNLAAFHPLRLKETKWAIKLATKTCYQSLLRGPCQSPCQLE